MASGVLQPGRGWRVLFALVLTLAIGVYFWTQSRYPDLNDKALMSGAIELEDPLSFEALIPIQDDHSTVERVIYSTLNWIKTNRKGMTFGVFFGAAFLTVLGYLRRRNFRNGFLNSLTGGLMGAPLGVCVNCAAPIAKGLYSGGARAETTLSAMVASPTMNVPVLIIMFSLMPAYLAFTKIALSLFVILIAVPIIVRFLKPEDLLAKGFENEAACPVPDSAPVAEPLPEAAWRFAQDFAANLWFILRTTVPLMLLAGFLGALFATLVPPEYLSGRDFGPLGLALAALVGAFAPVPIGFDVFFSAALLGGGMSPGYVMTMLFTLGSFSIYSFIIVGNAISWRAAGLMMGVIAALGFFAGLGAHYYNSWQTDRALDLLTAPPAPVASILKQGAPRGGESPAVLIAQDSAEGGYQISWTSREFNPPSQPLGETGFTRLEAWRIGVDKPVEFSFADMWPPFWEGRSLSTGDVDGDGDLDLVHASTEAGLYLYLNDGAGNFTDAAPDLGAIAGWPVFNAALVDLDDDGWLDLFLTTYLQGEHWVRNLGGGRFDFAAPRPVSNREDGVLALSLAFADADRDGDLDVALGNWAAGWYRRIPGEESRNRVIFNAGGDLTGDHLDLPGLPGETLSLLFSDIDGDGAQDLLVGNDFEIPDYFYFGDGAGGFEPVERGDGLIPMTTTTTMALAAADLTNDGRAELYAAQISGRAQSVSERLKMQDIELYCGAIERESDRALCQLNMDIKAWYRSGNQLDPSNASRCNALPGPYQGECRGMMIKDLAIQRRDPQLCDLIPFDQPRARAYCDIHFRPIRQPSQAEMDAAVPQILARNVLLSPAEGRRYEETAIDFGLEVGGWSWDVKIADFDNDEWQDVYIVNGTWVPNEVTPSNLFFHNQGGEGFAEASGPFGLEDYLMTAAAIAADLDFDGDLDLLTATVNGPPAAFINNLQTGEAIAFEIRDEKGNHFGVGSRIEILYGDGRAQMRELQSGGGFMSFDAPIAHFGLGAQTGVDAVRIHWSTGETSLIETPFESGALHTLTRRSALEETAP